MAMHSWDAVSAIRSVCDGKHLQILVFLSADCSNSKRDSVAGETAIGNMHVSELQDIMGACLNRERLY